MKLKIATAQYSIGEPADFAAFAARVGDRVAQAARAGAGLVVLPEYLSLEAAAGQPAEVRSDFARSLAALQLITTTTSRSRAISRCGIRSISSPEHSCSTSAAAAIAIARISRRPMARSRSRTS